jgi:hypothetical protein
MKHCKMILMSFAVFGGILLGVGATTNPAAAQTTVACPPGYYYLPGSGCQIFGGAPPAYAYAYPYAYPPAYYAPFGVVGAFGSRDGFHDHGFVGHEGFHGGHR